MSAPGRKEEGGSAHVESPRFTIITSSFNQAQYLDATIRSVRDQDRNDVEHLVFDGGSTDGSVEILREHDDSLAYWTSAPDDGQPAAWNAGITRARGKILAFLNSDDLYLPGGLGAIAQLADECPDADWLVGGTLYFGTGSGGLSHPGAAPRHASDVLYFVKYAPQPGHFFRKSLVDRVGLMDESFQFGFDFDFMIRCALAGARSAAIDRVVAAFRYHEASKTVTLQDVQRDDRAAIEARHWPEIERREGAHARRARANDKGHVALGHVRAADAEGRSGEAWRLLRDTIRAYPSMIGTRAFIGTLQRLSGMRAD